MYVLTSPQKHVVGTHQKCLNEALLMSTHNIRCCRETKIFFILLTPSYMEVLFLHKEFILYLKQKQTPVFRVFCHGDILHVILSNIHLHLYLLKVKYSFKPTLICTRHVNRLIEDISAIYMLSIK